MPPGARSLQLHRNQFERRAATRTVDKRIRRLVRTLGTNLFAPRNRRVGSNALFHAIGMMRRASGVGGKVHDGENVVIGDRRVVLRLNGALRTSAHSAESIWIIPVSSGAFHSHSIPLCLRKHSTNGIAKTRKPSPYINIASLLDLSIFFTSARPTSASRRSPCDALTHPWERPHQGGRPGLARRKHRGWDPRSPRSPPKPTPYRERSPRHLPRPAFWRIVAAAIPMRHGRPDDLGRRRFFGSKSLPNAARRRRSEGRIPDASPGPSCKIRATAGPFSVDW